MYLLIFGILKVKFDVGRKRHKKLFNLLWFYMLQVLYRKKYYVDSKMEKKNSCLSHHKIFYFLKIGWEIKAYSEAFSTDF